MSAVITSITRQNPVPCQHWEITATIDGNPNQKSKIYDQEEILTLGDTLPVGYREAFYMLSLRRHYELGGNRTQIIGVDLEGHLGPPAESFGVTNAETTARKSYPRRLWEALGYLSKVAINRE